MHPKILHHRHARPTNRPTRLLITKMKASSNPRGTSSHISTIIWSQMNRKRMMKSHQRRLQAPDQADAIVLIDFVIDVILHFSSFYYIAMAKFLDGDCIFSSRFVGAAFKWIFCKICWIKWSSGLSLKDLRYRMKESLPDQLQDWGRYYHA